MVAPYKDHRLLLLKLDKQMGGTIYCFFTSNEAQGLEGVEYHIGGGGGVQYICLVGCKIQPVDGYVPVCLVLTIDVYVRTRFDCLFTFISLKKVKFAQS